MPSRSLGYTHRRQTLEPPVPVSVGLKVEQRWNVYFWDSWCVTVLRNRHNMGTEHGENKQEKKEGRCGDAGI